MTIITARDAAHKLMAEEKPNFIRPYLHYQKIIVALTETGLWGCLLMKSFDLFYALNIQRNVEAR